MAKGKPSTELVEQLRALCDIIMHYEPSGELLLFVYLYAINERFTADRKARKIIQNGYLGAKAEIEALKKTMEEMEAAGEEDDGEDDDNGDDEVGGTEE